MAINPYLAQSFSPLNAQPPSGQVYEIIPVTPDDSIDLPTGTRCLYVETAGVVGMLMFNGQIRNVTLNQGWHPIIPQRIRVTGTNATVWVGL